MAWLLEADIPRCPMKPAVVFEGTVDLGSLRVLLWVREGVVRSVSPTVGWGVRLLCQAQQPFEDRRTQSRADGDSCTPLPGLHG